MYWEALGSTLLRPTSDSISTGTVLNATDVVLKLVYGAQQHAY